MGKRRLPAPGPTLRKAVRRRPPPALEFQYGDRLPPAEFTTSEAIDEVFAMARDMSGGYGLSPEGMQIWADWLAAFAVILIDRVDPDEKFSTMRAKVEIVSTPPTEADADPAPVPS